MPRSTRSGVYVRIADRVSRYYAPFVHLVALGTVVGWLLVGAGWHMALTTAVAVLIITCPCALGLAVPVVQVVASGFLLGRGIMVKDGGALERLADDRHRRLRQDRNPHRGRAAAGSRAGRDTGRVVARRGPRQCEPPSARPRPGACRGPEFHCPAGAR